MKWFKRFLWLCLLVALLAAAATGFYIERAYPAMDGRVQAPGLLAAANVTRDDADVTHIQAQSPHDAWFSLGYVHAQERGWQLEFNRRLMHGELAEVLGPAALDTDKLLRALGVARAAQRQWQQLPAEARDALQAYSDGINAFHASSSQALPPEFHLLGTRPGGSSGAPWSPADSVGWALMMALDLGGNWGTEWARLSAARTLDTAALWQLLPPSPGEAPASSADVSRLYADLGVYRRAPSQTSKAVAPGDSAGGLAVNAIVARDGAALAGEFGQIEGKGSNNWVVSGRHTASGQTLLANDPHLGLSAPAIWYVARLKAPAGEGGGALDVMGATIPGLPFVVLGRTRSAAWTFTNTNPDVQDLYLEQLNPANPAQYRVPATAAQAGGGAQWADFAVRQERIRVKGAADVSIAVRETRHGPVLSDVVKAQADLLDTGRYALALRWSALDADNQTVLAGLRANRAQSVDDLLAAFAAYHSPMQNVIAADTAGRIAYKAVGKVPLRQPSNDIRGTAPSPGWDARYDWAGWVPYAQTPEVGDAAIQTRGWFATANQNITPPDYPFFLGQDWSAPYRHDRIEQLLAASPRHDLKSMQAMQRDEFSGATALLLPYLQAAMQAPGFSHPLAGKLPKAMAGFTGDMRADSAAPLVFAAWADELTRGVLAPRLGQPTFDALYGKRNFRAALEGILARDDASWCGAGGCAAASVAALDRALTRLDARYGDDLGQWRWGRAHVAVSAHRPFGNVPWLARFFDVRVPTDGDTYSVNAGQYWSTGDKPFANRQAASLRVVYDFADLENSRFIYQTGQSGLVFSSRYRDMRKPWAAVQDRPLRMDPPRMAHRLSLQP